jgi:hypothetical protein
MLLILSQVAIDQAAIHAGQGIAGLTSSMLAIEVLAWFVAMGWVGFSRPSHQKNAASSPGTFARPTA